MNFLLMRPSSWDVMDWEGAWGLPFSSVMGIDARCFIEVDDRDINTFIRNLRDEMLFGLIAARKSDGFGSGKSYSIVHNPAVDKVTDKEVFQDEIL